MFFFSTNLRCAALAEGATRGSTLRPSGAVDAALLNPSYPIAVPTHYASLSTGATGAAEAEKEEEEEEGGEDAPK